MRNETKTLAAEQLAINFGKFLFASNFHPDSNSANKLRLEQNEFDNYFEFTYGQVLNQFQKGKTFVICSHCEGDKRVEGGQYCCDGRDCLCGGKRTKECPECAGNGYKIVNI